MGFSGFKGQVYYILPDQNPLSEAGVWVEPGESDILWSDEITKFTFEDSVIQTEYGHDKSVGWQDSVEGIRRGTITIDAKIGKGNTSGVGGMSPMQAGKVFWLKLYPVGDYNIVYPARGYATVKQVSYTYDQQNGEPIAYTATLSTKGPWKGAGEAAWGGFQFED